ncbi:MAG: hypothetical protein HY943_01325 [Gammaproteobacteria bacterium]|nr:hypothetical protein [Gammaproteobacteria bacterium]
MVTKIEKAKYDAASVVMLERDLLDKLKKKRDGADFSLTPYEQRKLLDVALEQHRVLGLLLGPNT